MKVALIRPPEVNPYWKAKRPSLGISYIASYLKTHSTEAKLFDANYNAWSEQQTVEPRLIVSTPAAPELDGELLEGRVVDTRGSGIASVQIVLCAEDGSIPETRTGGGTDPTGHFSFPGPDRSWQTHAAFESEAYLDSCYRIVTMPTPVP